MTQAALPLTVLGACHHDCPDTCSWEVTVEDGVATRLRGSASHPFTRGTLCPKVNRFLDRVYHPDRLLRPLRRVGPKGSGAFEEITWDEAITGIADRMRTLTASGRAESILQFSSAGTQGLIQMGVVMDRLFDLVGASGIRGEICGATSRMGAADVLGIPISADPESARHARTIVLWGTNPRLTNRHLWPFIEEARAAGAVVVVVDPIRTETARSVDEHFQVRPGSDVALVLGLVHVIARDGLLDEEWLADRTTGADALLDSALEWTPTRAAQVTGIDAERIERLAHRMAMHGPTLVRSLVGPEHRENGLEIARAVAMLPAVLGSWREVGGGLARSTSSWPGLALAVPERAPRRLVNMSRLGQVLSDPRDDDPEVEVLFVHNANPAVVLPDQNRVIAGLQREDLFTVVVDQFLTDTARYADIVLPATTQVEHLDLMDAWGHLYLALNQPAIEPRGEALPNSEVARRLAAALGIEDEVLATTDEQLIRDALDSGHPFLDGITYERLRDEGWARLAVPDGSRPHVDPLPGIPVTRMRLGALRHVAAQESPEGDEDLAAAHPLVLMTRKQHNKFLNSSYGGHRGHHPSNGEPVLQIHERDAAERGVSTGQRVLVRNARGSLTLTAEVSGDVQPGVVAIPFGWWHGSTPEVRAVNSLTNAALPDDDRGSSFFHDTLVEVSPA
jgi:anaerobic selenocysteine-containing dehydrogenase